MTPKNHLPLAVLLAVVCSILQASAQDPVAPPQGFTPVNDFDQTIGYGDGYNARFDVTYPLEAAPPGGWALVLNCHGIGGDRTQTRGSQNSQAMQGYVAIGYDIRGHGDLANDPVNAGKGSTLMGVRERRDMKELIELVLGLYPGIADPSRIGVVGGSQGGAHAWMAAAWSGQPVDDLDPTAGNFPGIACVVASNHSPDYGDMKVPGGQAFGAASAGAERNSANLTIEPGLLAFLVGAYQTEDYAGLRAAWDDPNRNWFARAQTIAVPILHINAYDDMAWVPDGSWRAFQVMPPTTPKKLFLTTGGHQSPNNTEENAVRAALTTAWLSRFLKGNANGADLGPTYVYAVEPFAGFTATTSAWYRRGADQFPPAGPAPLRLHLGPQGALLPSAPAQSGQTALSQVIANPGYTPIAAYNQAYSPQSMLTWIPLQEVTATGAPLAADVEVTGAFTATLDVQSTASAWQITAVLGARQGANFRYISSGILTERGAGATIPGPRTITGHLHAVRVPAGASLELRLRNVSLHHDGFGAQFVRTSPVFTPFATNIRFGAATDSFVDVPLTTPLPFAPVLTQNRDAASTTSTQNWQLVLHGGAGAAGEWGVLALSLSGMTPGILVDGFPVALNPDALTDYAIAFPDAPPLSHLIAPIPANNNHSGTITLAAGQIASLAGSSINAVGAILDNPTLALRGVSNPTAISIY